MERELLNGLMVTWDLKQQCNIPVLFLLEIIQNQILLGLHLQEKIKIKTLVQKQYILEKILVQQLNQNPLAKMVEFQVIVDY